MDRIAYALSGLLVFGILPCAGVLVCWNYGGMLLAGLWAIVMIPAWLALVLCVASSCSRSWATFPALPRQARSPARSMPAKAARAVHGTKPTGGASAGRRRLPAPWAHAAGAVQSPV